MPISWHPPAAMPRQEHVQPAAAGVPRVENPAPEAEGPRLIVAVEPVLVVPADAARLLGVGRSTLDALERAGRIGPRPVDLGRKVVLYPLAELRAWSACGCPPRVEWLRRREAEERLGVKR